MNFEVALKNFDVADALLIQQMGDAVVRRAILALDFQVLDFIIVQLKQRLLLFHKAARDGVCLFLAWFG